MTAGEIHMRRKVQQLGSSTLAVSLPAEWVREHDIEKGDVLIGQSDEHSGSLLLLPDDHKSTDIVATIDADSLSPEVLEDVVLAHYTLGRHTIRIDGDEASSPAFTSRIDDLERRLMGLGVVERSRDQVEIRCSVAPGDFELVTLLERLWRTESLIREEAVTALLENESDQAAVARSYEKQAEKLFSLFLRLLFTTYRNPRLNRTMGLKTGFPLIGYRSVAQDLVLMTRCSSRIAALADECGDLDAETRAVFEQVTVSLEAAVEHARDGLTEPRIESIETAADSQHTFTTALQDAQRHLEAERPEPVLELQRILSTLREIGIYTRDTTEVATNLAARDVSRIDTER